MNEFSVSADGQDLDWLLNDLVARVADVLHAVVLANDGLLRHQSRGLPQELAESLAASASSLHGVAKSPGQILDTGAVQQVVVEYQNGYLIVMAAGPNASLAVYTGADVDLGQVAFEMTTMVKRVGANFRSEKRGTFGAPYYQVRA